MPFIPIMIAVVLALGGGTATLANSANPGDALYPVDQWMEQMQERFTTRIEAKARLYANLSDERLAELVKLRAKNSGKFDATAQQRWEEHHEAAIARLTTRVEQITALQEQFTAKLNATADAEQKAIFQDILDHFKVVQARREARLKAAAEAEITLPPGWELEKKMYEFRQERGQQLREMHQEMAEQFREAIEKQLNDREDEDEDENEDEDKDDDSSTSGTSVNSSTSVQTTLEARIPRNPITGEIDWDYYDTDHDGIPDKWDPMPNWPPHTLSADVQV